MTIGDVLAVVSFLAGAGLSWWALLVGSALLWHGRANWARAQLEARTGRVLATGVGAALGGGALIALLANLPNGVLKLSGWLLFFVMLGVAALGGGAIASLLGERLRRACPDLSVLGAVSRAAALLVGAQFVPLLGWFVLLPLCFLFALGAGCRALWNLRAPRLAKATASQVTATPIAATPPVTVAASYEIPRVEVLR